MASHSVPDPEAISELTTGRLSVYLRCLTYLQSINQHTVSSHELAERFHLNSAQIRKDLAFFGEFGTRGGRILATCKYLRCTGGLRPPAPAREGGRPQAARTNRANYTYSSSPQLPSSTFFR